MSARPKAWLSWSSGKDSAWALHVLGQAGALEVVGLLTVVNRTARRVAMHAVRERLLELQARAVGLPLVQVPIPDPCSNAEYEAAMAAALETARAERVTHVAFGDLFLADVRRYREEKLAGSGLEPVFPLWGADTRELARAMLAAGLGATVTCIDTRVLPRELAGRPFDEAFLAALPPGADPCGENGEFHTFVHAGPMLRAPLAVRAGELREAGDFLFADLVPVPAAAAGGRRT